MTNADGRKEEAVGAAVNDAKRKISGIDALVLVISSKHRSKHPGGGKREINFVVALIWHGCRFG
jgi:hypothetical protein